MRISSFVVLAAGIFLAAFAAVQASDLTAYLAALPDHARLLLMGVAGAFALIWLLVLRLSAHIDQQDVAARIGVQEGRETIAVIRQKSVALEDRQDALEEYISASDSRRAIRHWIVIEVALPYLALICVSAIVLFLALKSIGGIP